MPPAETEIPTSSVAVAVVNLNTREHLRACLRSVVAEPAAEVVVADNGSTDGSVERVRAHFPDAVVVENGTNLGFSGGNNAGIRAAL